MNSNHIISLNEIGNLPLEEVGGKALGLSWLISNGFNVPRGYILCQSLMKDFLFFHNIEESRLIELALSHDIEEVHKFLILLGWPDNMKSLLAQVFSCLSQYSSSFAIRSSAVCEDGGSGSYAGQLFTALNIQSFHEMLDSILKCWASFYRKNYVQYQFNLGESANVNGIGVIVQEMITPDVSGVLFTCDPITNDLSIGVAEVHSGLAEHVVSGRSYCDLYYYSFIEHKVIKKILNSHVQHPIEEKMLIELFQKAFLIHIKRQWPQDLEWSIMLSPDKSSQIFFLQTRPITTFKSEALKNLKSYTG